MSKQRLMLSAAAAVLCASALAARADITIDSSTTTPLDTTTNGNITIDSSGGIAVQNGGAVVTLDSNNFVTNNGVISNGNNANASGILIDLTDHSVLAGPGGLTSSNTITVTGGTGLSMSGVLITGGNTYFGGITLNNVTPVGLLGKGSTLTVSGNSVTAFNMAAGSAVDGDIAFGGSISALPASSPAAGAAGPIIAYLAGTVNGNVVFDDTVAASADGTGSEGVVVLGGIHACSNDAIAEATIGYVCGTGTAGLGALINNGKIVTVGQVVITESQLNPNNKTPILEGSSALAVGASIDGGIFNGGPYTANTTAPVGAFSGNGANGFSVVDIDPGLTGNAITAINIGPVSSVLDSVDPGYSFDNRGSISATPGAPQVSTVAMFVQGASTGIYTCFGNGTFASCGNDGLGGLLTTGSITAAATTNATGVVTTNINAIAMSIGPYAAIPRIVVEQENAALGVTTAGTISASVSGTSGGIANAIDITSFASVPTIDVGQGASIKASVTTTDLEPTLAVSPSNAPFTLAATAISDGSSSLTTINNAGTISASITIVTPGVGANVVTSVRAIDLTSSLANGITINNSGQILGDVIFGEGNNYTLNVGNTDTSSGGATANQQTNVINSPNNYAVVAYSIDSQTAGSPPTTEFNQINFGGGTGHVLHVGAYGYVNSVITSNPGALAVTVDNNGTLFIANTGTSLNASTFDINGGTLGITLSQANTATTPVIQATTEATIAQSAAVAMQFGSFVSAGTTLASVTSPTTQNLVLINAPVINMSANTLTQDSQVLSQNIPFLFEPNAAPLSFGTSAGNQTLVLSLTPRVPGAVNPTDGVPGLGLTGDALAQFPFVVSALATDPTLGAAIATSLTVYNTPGVSSSGINVRASQQQAQQAFSQFGPDTSGGARQVAILITDQASGPVAARQRVLHSFDNVAGDLTLWGTEFAGDINNKGLVDADNSLTNYKDHGFGFTLGLDSGSPRGGWYGGAFTFYSGDVIQTLPRDTDTHTQWYMLSGYTSWKGSHLFFDTQLSAAYGNFKGLRDLTVDVDSTEREASGKRAGEMGALGANMGAIFNAGGLQISPHFSLDGLSLREEGYQESGGGDGLDLAVAPYYANSLRTGLGVDFSTGLNVFGVTLTPDARFGYRYDLVNSPVKLKAGFISTGGVDTPGNSMTFVGPDPDTGNIVGGISLSAGTDTWHLGVHYDYLRGNNGSITQVGTVSLLGRI